MEDKHIYSTSFLSKLQDKAGDFIKETGNIVQSLLPKRRKKKSPTVPMEPSKKVIPQTPVVTTTAFKEKKEKPKIKKQKTKETKKEKVKMFHYRKVADEHVQKTLVASLTIAIISIFGVGAYLTYKNNLYPEQSFQELRQTPTKISTNTTINWETYKNDQYNLTFNYPPSLKHSGNVNQSYLINKDSTVSENLDSSSHLVEIKVNNNIQHFNRYLNTQSGSVVRDFGDLKLRDFKINDYNAVEYAYDKTQKQMQVDSQKDVIKSGAQVGIINYHKGLLINKNGTIIEISTNSYDGEFKQTFDQILSTLKFSD